MVIARQAGMSHSTVATVLKSKNHVLKAAKRSDLLKGTQRRPMSYMEKLLMTGTEEWTQK